MNLHRELLLNMGSAKGKHGVPERFAKSNLLSAKNGHSCIQREVDHNPDIYVYI